MLVVRDDRLGDALDRIGEKPALVITDSQVFREVSKITPKEVYLTSFSILFARYKGDLKHTVQGARVLKTIKDGDNILISEGCTHRRQCGDIGTENSRSGFEIIQESPRSFPLLRGQNFHRI